MSAMYVTASRLGRWLAFPRIIWASLGVALVTTLPSLRAGFVADAYLILGVLEHRVSPVPVYDSPLALFRYAVGDPASMQQNIVRGIFPWWTLPELKLAFFRPLSSALIWLDHALFGSLPLAVQAHSILWYLVLVAVVGALMRRVLPSAIGGLAVLLFALDGKHPALVVTFSDRNYVLAAVFAFLGLLFYVKWREGDGPRNLALALVGLTLGLASSETGLIVYAYLIAYELLAGRGTAGARLRALVPAALLLGAWALAYAGLGYGVYGSDLFLSPLTQTADWLRTWPTSLPVLLGSVLLNVPADLAEPLEVSWLTWSGLVGLVVVGLLLRACWGRLAAEERRHVRWLLAGAALALPASAVMYPTIRQLLMPSLGGAVAIAAVLARSFVPRERAWSWYAQVAGAGLLALLHFVGSPYMGYQAQAVTAWMSQRSADIQEVLTHELNEAQLPSQRVAVLAVPSLLYGVYSTPRWWATGHPLPRAWWTLSLAPGIHRVTRTAPDTLEMELREGRFFGSIYERAHRTARHPLAAGTVVQLDGARAEVAEVDSEGIRKLRFRFDVPLEDPSLVLLHWKEKALRRFTPPPVGSTVEINLR